MIKVAATVSIEFDTDDEEEAIHNFQKDIWSLGGKIIDEVITG